MLACEGELAPKVVLQCAEPTPAVPRLRAVAVVYVHERALGQGGLGHGLWKGELLAGALASAGSWSFMGLG